MKRFSRWLLWIAEWFFLLTHGWKRIGPDLWKQPDNYDKKRNGGEPYRGGHAVNSQKWTIAQDMKARRMRERDFFVKRDEP